MVWIGIETPAGWVTAVDRATVVMNDENDVALGAKKSDIQTAKKTYTDAAKMEAWHDACSRTDNIAGITSWNENVDDANMITSAESANLNLSARHPAAANTMWRYPVKTGYAAGSFVMAEKKMAA